MNFNHRNLTLSALAAITIAVALPACALPPDDGVTTYDPDDLPTALTETTTTTTTTTTTLPAPTSSVDPPAGGETTTTNVSTTTTTIALVETEVAEIFYTVGLSDNLQRVRQNLIPAITVQDLIDQLGSPPPEIREFNLRSAVRPNLVVEVETERGVATVSLSQDTLDLMPDSQERRAISQLVLTLTSFVTPADGAIGRVAFEVDGDPISVFIPGEGSTEPGEPVAFGDYASLIVDGQAASSGTTSTTTSTVPDPEQ